MSFNCNVMKIIILLSASQLFFMAATAADTQKFDQVLIIGRPERGGVNISQVPKRFSHIRENTIWYLDPRSEGKFSIRDSFPCSIPGDKPQQFAVVCIEQGMLNEVVTHVRNPVSSLAPSISLAQCESASDEDAQLSRLNAEREIMWQKCEHSKRAMVSLEDRVIKKAISAKLISESFEFGYVYYRLIGERNTSIGTIIVHRLFSSEKGCMPEEEEEYRKLCAEIDEEKRQVDEIDAVRDPIIKRQYAARSAMADNSVSTTTLAPIVERDPREVSEHIQNFVQNAWNLVRPGGYMVVFSRNARVEGTILADGISLEYLKSILTNYDEFEEVFFAAQSYEGERYISNPVFPANTESFGWGGGRPDSSYFLIRKKI